MRTLCLHLQIRQVGDLRLDILSDCSAEAADRLAETLRDPVNKVCRDLVDFTTNDQDSNNASTSLATHATHGQAVYDFMVEVNNVGLGENTVHHGVTMAVVDWHVVSAVDEDGEVCDGGVVHAWMHSARVGSCMGVL